MLRVIVGKGSNILKRYTIQIIICLILDTFNAMLDNNFLTYLIGLTEKHENEICAFI